MALPRPVRGNVYTSKEVFGLYLLDGPFFLFWHNDEKCVIQTSHLSEEDLLKVPGFSELQWKYIKTTDEWIPVFEAVSDTDVLVTVDIAPCVGEDGYWVTPKGHPREQ